jgi:hypothetical protein
MDVEINGRECEIDYRALHYKVLIVAKANKDVGDWKAYIAPVPGQNHDEEWRDALADGSPLTRDLGEFLFPHFAEKFTWRR